MKKTAAIIGAAVIGICSVSGQTLNLCQGNVIYSYPAATMGEAVVTDAKSINIGGTGFNISDLSEMFVDNSTVEDNTVTIAYSEGAATVTIAGNVARYVSASVDGAHVKIIQSEETGDTSGEIIYSLSGKSSDGSFYMEGSYKASMELRGLDLTNPSGAAIDIQNGKRIELSVKSGTVNTLTDGASGSQKGTIVCKGHLELKGKGELNVLGKTAHAIYAKEYVEMKNCTVNITGAVKDGINCAQYFLLESGSLNISGTGDDGIQTSFKDDTDREAEDTGSITVSGGTLNVAVTADASKGIKADADIFITGGKLDISVTGKGIWDSSKAKTKASSCIGADGDVTVDGGTLILTASGSGGKGISCDGTLTINDGDFTVKTSGGIFAYVNGKEYDGYTGNTDRLDSDAKSSPKGMKADTEIIINGGTINVETTGVGGEGIESKGTLTINGGTIVVNSYDDAINSSSHLYINGGDITVVATNNDGLDSNGNLYLNGGYVRAFGAGAPECGIDANEESGYTVVFPGGTMIAVGGSNSTPRNSETTQAYISGSGQATASSEISLKSGDTVLASFTVPANYKSSGSQGGGFGPGGRPGGPGGMGGGSILITCPGLTSGTSYTLVNSTTTSSVTARK